MPWGQIAGAVIGGVMANQAAKRQAAAMDRANAANNMGYTDARPYVLDVYRSGTDAMRDQLNTGYYDGPTYAGLTDMQRAGLDNQYNFGNTGFGYANQMLGTGAGYGTNYQNLFNRAGQDQIGDAVNYANANAQPLIDAALRDSTRNLTENTLRDIGMSASASNNTNSSRAGVAEAIAGRDYLDRAADTGAGIRDRLAKDYLTQNQNQFANQMAANQGLGNVFNTGFGMGGDAANMMQLAGSAYQKDLQNQYNDARERFEGERDFASNVYSDYNSQILKGAPRTPAMQRANTVDPTMAALSGAMAGFGFGRKYFPSQQQAPAAAPQYGTATGVQRPYTPFGL